MKSILWSQSSDATSKDIFIIDGVASLDEQTTEQMSASNKLFECYNWGMYHKDDIQALKKRGKLLSNTFVSYKKDDGFYFSSNYSNKDVVGRLIAFQFYCATDDFKLAMDEFVRVSKLIEREYSDSEIKLLLDIVKAPGIQNRSSHLNKNNYKLWLYLLGGIVLSLLIIKSCIK